MIFLDPGRPIMTVTKWSFCAILSDLFKLLTNCCAIGGVCWEAECWVGVECGGEGSYVIGWARVCYWAQIGWVSWMLILLADCWACWCCWAEQYAVIEIADWLSTSFSILGGGKLASTLNGMLDIYRPARRRLAEKPRVGVDLGKRG